MTEDERMFVIALSRGLAQLATKVSENEDGAPAQGGEHWWQTPE